MHQPPSPARCRFLPQISYLLFDGSRQYTCRRVIGAACSRMQIQGLQMRVDIKTDAFSVCLDIHTHLDESILALQNSSQSEDFP